MSDIHRWLIRQQIQRTTIHFFNENMRFTDISCLTFNDLKYESTNPARTPSQMSDTVVSAPLIHWSKAIILCASLTKMRYLQKICLLQTDLIAIQQFNSVRS